MLVHPLGFDMYVNMKPLSGGAFPASPERGVQVLLLTVVTQHQPDTREDFFIIAGEIVEIPKHIGIRKNVEPTFAQHAKAAECSDGVQI
jgi:hypothetical protein